MNLIVKTKVSFCGIKKFIFGFSLLVNSLVFSFSNGYCQPYFDVGGVSAWHMPKNNSLVPYTETYFLAFLSLPIELGKGNKIIVSPFYENRLLKTEVIDKSYSFNGVCIPVTFLHYCKDSIYSFTITILPRTNGNSAEINNTALQYGGAFINTIKLKPNFKLKFGLYYNREYFSDFFIPLAGFDWKINERINLFGVLPGSMKFEYQFSKNIYSGIVFKSITNSYRFGNEEGYFKLKDNHIGVFTDFYLPKKITLITEVGYTVFREAKNRSNALLADLKGDGFIFKAGVAYRLRLDN